MSEIDIFIEKVGNKDESVFEDLYKQHHVAVFNYLFIKTKGNVDVSNDILSETFCSFMESFDKIKRFDNMKGFLIGIASRKLSDFLRKEYHDKNYDKYFEINETKNDHLADDLHKKEQLLMVNVAIDNLKPLFRNVLKLKYIEEKTQNEISEILGKSVSSVETLLVRAKKQLRAELKKLKGFSHEI